ncbi:MAG: ATP-dependent DNA helicase RecG [Hyphomonadaceae bacterium]|nr:ATP-dependent DNA helicase RecG [Clostridia bacterium]
MKEGDFLLHSPITAIKGIGQARAKALERLEVSTVEDLLHYFPRTYQDRTKLTSIIDLKHGDQTCVHVVVLNKVTERRMRKGLAVYQVKLGDKSGTMTATWFNQRFVMNALEVGKAYIFFGDIQVDRYGSSMQNPIYESVDHAGRYTQNIVPIYRVNDGITQKQMFTAIENAYGMVKTQLTEYLPDWVLQAHDLPDFSQAILNIHFPINADSFLQARKRFVIEEFLLLQLGLLRIKGQSDVLTGLALPMKASVSTFIKALPFTLTLAQQKVVKEITADMAKPIPMRRLLQGDVGSGKTIVAAIAMVLAVQNGTQAALMAPTEILATQHYHSFQKLLERLNIKLALLTSSTPKKQKDAIFEGLKTGEIALVIGTHALIEQNVQFSKLALVVTDEQHRFGVRQRAALSDKGDNPHTLVMSATPIPRTLALILYSDLDVSIIDQLPPGRKPIKTYTVTDNYRKRVYEFVKKEVVAGRQAYIVCPLIEQSESTDLTAAVAFAKTLQDGALYGLMVGLLHGKMKPSEKEAVMQAFVNGDIKVLVATTVIEVGVNVPNATVMVIENCERFGLSQLHQLRGRVGRGEDESHCILFSEAQSKLTKERLAVMCQTNDGFKISEKDLSLRGPGDFFGTRQHGLPELHIANLFEDMPLLAIAQDIAKVIREKDRQLELAENQPLREKIERSFGTKWALPTPAPF